MQKTIKKHNYLFDFFLVTLFVNIVIPKAGIKIVDVPITLGTVLFAVLLIIYIYIYILNHKKRHKNDKVTKAFWLLLIYVFVRSIISLLLGWNIVDFITYFSCMTIYPLIFFVIQYVIKDTKKLNKTFKVICIGTNIILLYAILQMVFGIDKVCIPGM